MSDFDLSLIREFRNRPAFYDRNSPLFKDKAFNAQAWQEISNILGYDVALLKDRMLQLRNRYNLEKRRLEQLAEETPEKYAHSPWPLYEHLGFLSDHIRSRRSFKRMPLPRRSSLEQSMMSDVGSHMSPPAALQAAYSAAPLANGMLTVKLENANDTETDSQSDSDTAVGESNSTTGHVGATPAAASTNFPNLNINSKLFKKAASTLPPPLPPVSTQQSITIRNLDSMRTIIPRHNILANKKNVVESTAINEPPEKKFCLNTREQKYEAFGQFVASSLGEMPKQQALLLVEHFTSEVVRVLIEKNATDSSPEKTPTDVLSNSFNQNCSNTQKEDSLQRQPQQQQQQQWTTN